LEKLFTVHEILIENPAFLMEACSENYLIKTRADRIIALYEIKYKPSSAQTEFQGSTVPSMSSYRRK
jgi:hypothetical protein